MSEGQDMFNRYADAGKEAAWRGEPLSANPWPAETFGGKAWALGWEIHRLPWWMRVAGRILGKLLPR